MNSLSMKGLIKTGLLSVMISLMSLPLSACSSNGQLRKNLGDQISSRLHVGMSAGEVERSLESVAKYLLSDRVMEVESERDLLYLYVKSYFPRSLVSGVSVGTKYRNLAYWERNSRASVGSLYLFFDEDMHILKGWVNSSSALGEDQFLHERLTSKLIWAGNGTRKGMNHAQVYAAIGRPTEIISPPKQSRAIYENHFWIQKPILDYPNQKIEVYRYEIEGGLKRSVFLLYYPKADELNAWGYDYAWEEADRYLLEQELKK